jgi:hypothetical protein
VRAFCNPLTHIASFFHSLLALDAPNKEKKKGTLDQFSKSDPWNLNSALCSVNLPEYLLFR